MKTVMPIEDYLESGNLIPIREYLKEKDSKLYSIKEQWWLKTVDIALYTLLSEPVAMIKLN